MATNFSTLWGPGKKNHVTCTIGLAKVIYPIIEIKRQSGSRDVEHLITN